MNRPELAMIAGMAVVTFAVRYPVLALLGHVPLPAPVLKAMKYIPPAVLTAIIVPAVLLPDGRTVNLTYTNAYLIAAIVALIVAWRCQNLLLTIVSGIVILWLWRWMITLLLMLGLR